MDTLSAIPAICEGSLPVIWGQRASNANLYGFICWQPEEADKQTAQLRCFIRRNADVTYCNSQMSEFLSEEKLIDSEDSCIVAQTEFRLLFAKTS